MIIFCNVRRHLSKTFSLVAAVGVLFVQSPVSAKPGDFPSFRCGFYRVEGRLLINSKRDFILTLYPGTRFQTELVTLDSLAIEKMKNLKALVRAEIFVPQPIYRSEPSYVFIKKLNAIEEETQGQPSLIKEAPCGFPKGGDSTTL